MDENDRQQHDQFRRFFMECEAELRLFARYLLFNQEEAREVMQEVAVVLWRKFDPELDSQSFRRWAFGVTRMEVLSYRRDRARDRHSFGDDVLELLEHDIQEEAETLQAEREALTRCIKKLPTDQQELVQSAYDHGVKKNDLAKRLGWTSMALYKKLHRIRLQLIKCTRKELATEGLV